MVEVSIPAFFAVGILAGGNPCALPLLPGFVGYLSSRGDSLQERDRSLVGVLIILGVVSSMLAFALVATIARVALGGLLTAATPVIVAVLVFFGALLIANHNPFYRLPVLKVPRLKNNLLEAYAYGGLYGVIALPCSSLIVIPTAFAISISSTAVGTLSVFLLYLVFGLGLGLPVMVVSLVSRVQGDWLVRQIAMRARTMNMVAGFILIGVAIYDLVVVQRLISASLPGTG